jgi:hypothetical protein
MAYVAATRQAMADAWKVLGAYIGLATGDPGTTATPASELTGGSYARVTTTWTSSTGGVVNGSAVTINAPGSVAITYAFQATGLSSNTQIDHIAVTSTTLPSAGTVVVTPTLTVT